MCYKIGYTEVNVLSIIFLISVYTFIGSFPIFLIWFQTDFKHLLWPVSALFASLL